MEGLLTPEAWRDKTFDESSRPHINTIYRWIKLGQIDTVKIGSKVYVCPMKYEHEDEEMAEVMAIAKKLG